MENDEMTATETEGMKNLREAHEREKARADKAEADLRNFVFQGAGVDTESWIGQQLVAAYDGDLSPDAIRNFAAEKGIALGGGVAGVEGEVLPPETQATLNAAIATNAAAQSKVNALTQGTQPRTAEATPEQQAAMALNEGRVKDSIALKAMQIRGER